MPKSNTQTDYPLLDLSAYFVETRDCCRRAQVCKTYSNFTWFNISIFT